MEESFKFFHGSIPEVVEKCPEVGDGLLLPFGIWRFLEGCLPTWLSRRAVGAAIGAVAWGLNQSFREATTYGNNGQQLDPKNASIFPKYDNVFGPVGEGGCQAGNSICSSIGHNMLFGDSGSWAHDGMLNYLGATSDSATNYLTMPHAGLLTVGASLHEFPSAPLNIDQTK